MSSQIRPAIAALGCAALPALTSPGNLTRGGWSRHSFKPGDRIELRFNPLRDGKHGGAFAQATFLDTGQTISSNLRAAEKPGLE